MLKDEKRAESISRFQFYGLPKSDTVQNLAMPLLELDHIAAWPVGSQTIPRAAKPDSDHDYLVLVEEIEPGNLSEAGFKLDSDDTHYDPTQGQFNSWRQGKVNLIVTRHRWFARKFLEANELAKRFKLIDRDDRVALFQAILYGNSETEELFEPEMDEEAFA